jgi:hypothetical protein
MTQVITTHREPFTIYTDRRFKKIASARWLYATIDAVTIGVILSTFNPDFNSFALDKGEFRRLLDALDAGKLVEAWAETVRFDLDSKTHVYDEIVEGRWLWERLKNVPTRMGSLGEFWSLSSLSGEDPM